MRVRRFPRRGRTVRSLMAPGATPTEAAMTPNPRTIAPDDPVEEAAAAVIELGVRHLPVVEGPRIVGFISARDLLARGRSRPVDFDQLTYEPWRTRDGARCRRRTSSGAWSPGPWSCSAGGAPGTRRP